MERFLSPIIEIIKNLTLKSAKLYFEWNKNYKTKFIIDVLHSKNIFYIRKNIDKKKQLTSMMIDDVIKVE